MIRSSKFLFYSSSQRSWIVSWCNWLTVTPPPSSWIRRALQHQNSAIAPSLRCHGKHFAPSNPLGHAWFWYTPHGIGGYHNFSIDSSAPIWQGGWRNNGIVSIYSDIAAANVIVITNVNMMDGNSACSRYPPCPGSGVMLHFWGRCTINNLNNISLHSNSRLSRRRRWKCL